jgi:geranylgeranyl diphosphate synthase type I
VQFADAVSLYRKRIDRALRAHLRRKVGELPAFGSRILRREHRAVTRAALAAGKRLRPTLTLVAYRAVGGRDERRIMNAALAFELFHAYTLVHDDIYDEDLYRRNEPTLHAGLTRSYRSASPMRGKAPALLFHDRATRFGVIGGVLGGEMLHNLCIGAILDAPVSGRQRLEGMRIYKEAGPADNACQLYDLALETEPMTERKYWELARYKSGKLLRAAVEWGAVLGGGSMSARAALAAYAELVGQAFQVKDDLLDIDVGGRKGRPIGSDLREGKKTLLTLRALQKARPVDRRTIARVFGSARATPTALRRAVQAIQGTDAVVYCERAAERKVRAAKQALRRAQPVLRADARRFLEQLADYATGRGS